jgi:hypothetical protein
MYLTYLCGNDAIFLQLRKGSIFLHTFFWEDFSTGLEEYSNGLQDFSAGLQKHLTGLGEYSAGLEDFLNGL